MREEFTKRCTFVSQYPQADYKAARKTCQILYGHQYGLAVIQSKQDLKDINAYVEQFMSREFHEIHFKSFRID